MAPQQRYSLLFGRGLLGSAIMRAAAGTSLNQASVIAATIPWGDKTRAEAAIRRSVAEFLSSEASRYDIYWCAGIATPRGDGALATAEAEYFEALMMAVGAAPSERQSSIRMFLASSAGALYPSEAGVAATESTPVLIRDAYGAAKARIEQVAIDGASKMNAALLIGRVSSLFGPGQNLRKPQGLLTHVAWSVLTRQPVFIHVDRMSTRNYLHVADAAELVVDSMDRCSPSEIRVQNVCSHRHHSIAEVIEIAEKTFARRANVVYVGSGVRSDLRVASDRPDIVRRHSRRSLAVGFGRIATDLRLQFCRSGGVWKPSA